MFPAPIAKLFEFNLFLNRLFVLARPIVNSFASRAL